jgi:beta-galactosidase
MKHQGLFFSLIAGACAFLSVSPVLSADTTRRHLSLDAGWRFHLGDEWPDAIHLDKSGTGSGPAAQGFTDSYWRVVDLPHDWAIELPFDATADGNHGFKALGRSFPNNSVAWYRRTFELPAGDSDKRIWLTFDGVMHDATVWVNGWLVRRHEGGYYPFREDITDVAHFGGTNTISVRVDATNFEGWFYEGAGIYRHVWLDETAPVAVAPDGIFVCPEFANNVPEGPAAVHLWTTVLNRQREASVAEVDWSIVAPDGQTIAEVGAHQVSNIAADSRAECSGEVRISSPRFPPGARSLTNKKPYSASAPWPFLRRRAFC